MKAFLVMLSLASLLQAQTLSIPFCMSGGGMTVTGSVTFPSLTMSGTASIGGQNASFTTGISSWPGTWWRSEVKIENQTYVLWVGVYNGEFCGYWYIPGVSTTATRMVA